MSRAIASIDDCTARNVDLGGCDRARLIRKTRRAADVNHRGDALRLLGRHVQQRVRAGAHADRPDAIDAETIDQREDVAGHVSEREDPSRIR